MDWVIVKWADRQLLAIQEDSFCSDGACAIAAQVEGNCVGMFAADRRMRNQRLMAALLPLTPTYRARSERRHEQDNGGRVHRSVVPKSNLVSQRVCS